jgi:AmiR/NasT family two-component response regulator
MTSALLFVGRPSTVPSLLVDLQSAVISVCATQSDITKLVRDVALHAPDVLICDVSVPNNSWFAAIRLLLQAVPCPMLVFTNDLNPDHAVKSVETGIHVFVVNGYSPQRLRPLIQLAQARFSQAEKQRKAIEDLAIRLEERKTVDRAKGILMRDQDLSDDVAFKVLRSTAMRTNLRLGQISQKVIKSAQDAEALNRAGQLRMLSQRLVKLHGLKNALVENESIFGMLMASIQRVDDNLLYLRSHLPVVTFGDILEPIEKSWQALRNALQLDFSTELDTQAEALLVCAERLTTSLENSGNAAPLHILNLVGRQRMLSQRYVKFVLQETANEGMLSAKNEFETTLTYLNGLPLSSSAIQEILRDAGIAWLVLVSASNSLLSDEKLGMIQRQKNLEELAECSESLLQLFEKLAEHYSHSLDMLVG